MGMIYMQIIIDLYIMYIYVNIYIYIYNKLCVYIYIYCIYIYVYVYTVYILYIYIYTVWQSKKETWLTKKKTWFTQNSECHHCSASGQWWNSKPGKSGETRFEVYLYNCLVVDLPPWKIWVKVSWDDDIPNIWKNNPNVPNNQPDNFIYQRYLWTFEVYQRYIYIYIYI